jgi:hypothetical protein
MEYKKQIKKVHTGHFAECNTRQRGALPSVKALTLGQEPRPGHRYRFFAECNTRQRGALPSVKAITLGKEPRPGHRYRFFAECNASDTRQRSTLCRVPDLVLGKEPDMGTLPDGFITECPRWHSAKMDPLPSVAGQTLGKDNSFVEFHQGHSAKPPSPSPGTVTAAFLCRVLSDTRQTFLPSAREKVLGKEDFTDALCAELSLPSATLGKAFVECF